MLYIVLLVYLLKEFLTILGRGWTVPTFPRGCFPPSKAKTRLAATIGNEAACRFGLLPVFEYGISSQLQYAKFHTETTQNPFLASGWQQFEAQFAASSFISDHFQEVGFILALMCPPCSPWCCFPRCFPSVEG